MVKNARFPITRLIVIQCGEVRTRGYVELAKKLDKPKQDLILTAGISTIDLSSLDDEDGEDRVTDAAKDPCAFLEIWYGFFSSFTENLY